LETLTKRDATVGEEVTFIVFSYF